MMDQNTKQVHTNRVTQIAQEKTIKNNAGDNYTSNAHINSIIYSYSNSLVYDLQVLEMTRQEAYDKVKEFENKTFVEGDTV